VLGLVMA